MYLKVWQNTEKCEQNVFDIDHGLRKTKFTFFIFIHFATVTCFKMKPTAVCIVKIFI